MYAPDRRQERDYQDRKDARYLSNENFYYRGPDAGTVVMRGSDPYNNAREHGLTVSSSLSMECTVLMVTSNISNLSMVADEMITTNEDVLHSSGAAHRGRHNVQDVTMVILTALARDRDRDQQRRRIALRPQWLEV